MTPTAEGTGPMQASAARKLNIVPFVSVDHMMRLVLDIGVERILTEHRRLHRGRISAAGNCSTRRRGSPRIRRSG